MQKRRAGSMTVEAALVLPLFLIAMLLVGYLMNMTYAHRVVASALENTCRKATSYAYAAENVTGSQLSSMGGSVVSTAYIQATVMGELSGQTLVNKLLVGTVSCLQSEVLSDGQTIDVIGEYAISLPFTLIPLRPFLFQQRARMHAWVGYEPAGGADGSGKEDEEYVYVAITGEVYHTSADCSYLNPSIHSVSGAEVAGLRNRDGSIYYPCACCSGTKASDGGTFYVTDYGERYHASPTCSGLKRTVEYVPLSEVGNLRPCSKCGGIH